MLSALAYLILSFVRCSQRDLKLSRSCSVLRSSPVNMCTSASALAALASDLQSANAFDRLNCFHIDQARVVQAIHDCHNCEQGGPEVENSVDC